MATSIGASGSTKVPARISARSRSRYVTASPFVVGDRPVRDLVGRVAMLDIMVVKGEMPRMGTLRPVLAAIVASLLDAVVSPC